MATPRSTKENDKENKLQARFASIDLLIRSGQIKKARHELREDLKQKLPRDWRAAYANLARRSGLPMVSLRILGTIFSQDHTLKPTSLENLAYGAGLAQIGAFREAREKLNATDSEEFPEALFHLALIEIMQWNYVSAESLLKRYLHNHRLSDYQKLIGQLNLASCYSATEKWLLAEPLLERIRAKAKQNEHRLIEANSLEILAQCFFFQKRFSQAQSILDEASQFIDDPTSPYSMYIKKWQILVDFFSAGTNKVNALKNLSALRKQASTIGLWETVRDIDFYTIWINQDSELLAKLKTGTPYKSYQKKIKAFFTEQNSNRATNADYFHQFTPEQSISLPEQSVEHASRYNRDFASKFNSKYRGAVEVRLMRTFNLTLGDEIEMPLAKRLRCGSLCHLFFSALMLDLYRPIRLGELFSILYPKEFFNPLTSPGRLQKVAQRLNHYFQENQIPLKIELAQQHFHLSCTNHYRVLISRKPPLTQTESQSHPRQHAMMLALKQSLLRQRSFSSQEICRFFKISERTALRFINQALAQNEIIIFGKGRARRYRIQSKLIQNNIKSLVDLPKSA